MKELDFALGLAKRAGTIMRDHFALGMEKEWKANTTPVTEADLAVNCLVLEAVKREYPGYGLIAEEESAYDGEAWTWICDPIDGTTPYAHGMPVSTFMLSLAHEGVVQLGVVYDPFMERLYSAARGKGAHLNGEPIRVSKESSLERAPIALTYWKPNRYLCKTHMRLLESHAKIVVVPSVGYMDMLVACGEFAASIFGSKRPWDSAAQSIIITEAGGRYTDLDGKEPRFTGEVEGHIASNGVLHERLLELIRRDR